MSCWVFYYIEMRLDIHIEVPSACCYSLPLEEGSSIKISDIEKIGMRERERESKPKNVYYSIYLLFVCVCVSMFVVYCSLIQF